ncbi:hypothetical protein AURDEDRAFT_72822 [Auricularia subglabra TFB-10046 SS5]|nr:hypothetical protein AURDEDRAFT_72822 [Auricularia subglabra TFB-10046 SS5]
MQRPRNRQNRQHNAGANNSSGGTGGRGRRGPPYTRGAPLGGPSSMPTAAQVVTGAHVSIVLKIDQPTGREVQGTVSEVLTSGNHPRGIKVRLRDGRVGRVQRMVSEADARAGSAGLSNLGRDGESASSPTGASTFYSRYRDYREEDDADRRPSGFTLADLIPDDDAQSSADLRAGDKPPPRSETHVCPVCNAFEGDEIAVAHHVSTHFD